MPTSHRILLRTVVASVCFFFLTGSYYMVRPMRTALSLTYFGRENFQFYAYNLPAVLTLCCVLFYNSLVSRYPRTNLLRLFFLSTLVVFVGFSALFAVMASFHTGSADLSLSHDWRFAGYFLVNFTAGFYYLFICVYILLFMSLFWSFNHDIHATEEAKLAYPYIFLGGQVGMIVGSQLTQMLTHKIGIYNLPALSAIGLAICWAFIERLKNFDPHIERNRYARPARTGAIEDFKLLWSNRYALFIAGIVILGTFTITVCDYQYKMLVSHSIKGGEAQTSFLAGNNVKMGFCNIAMCLVITPLLLRLIGPALAICLFPMTIAIAAVLFLWGMDVYTAAYFAIGISALNYTLYQTGKEVFFVPTDKNTRYKMKALCDIFGYRLGDFTGGTTIALYIALYTAFIGPVVLSGLNWILFAVILIWIPLIIAIGRRYKTLAAAEQEQLQE